MEESLSYVLGASLSTLDYALFLLSKEGCSKEMLNKFLTDSKVVIEGLLISEGILAYPLDKSCTSMVE